MTEYSDYGSLYRVEDDPWMADRVDRDRDQHDAELEERADRLGRDLPVISRCAVCSERPARAIYGGKCQTCFDGSRSEREEAA